MTTPARISAIAKALENCFDRMVNRHLGNETPDLAQSVSTIVKRALTLLLMLAVSGLAGLLPGTTITLFRSLTILLLLRFGIAVAAIWIIFSAYKQLVGMLGHVSRLAFRLAAGDAVLDAAILKLTWSVTLLIEVCLAYGIFMPAFSPILSACMSDRWPFLLIDLACLAIAVTAIISIFVTSSPLFGKLGEAIARRVQPITEELPQTKCPKCGVLSAVDSHYCFFCGTALPRTPQNTDGLTPGAPG